MKWNGPKLYAYDVRDDGDTFMGYVYKATIGDKTWFAIGRYTGNYYPQRQFANGPAAREWLETHCAEVVEGWVAEHAKLYRTVFYDPLAIQEDGDSPILDSAPLKRYRVAGRLDVWVEVEAETEKQAFYKAKSYEDVVDCSFLVAGRAMKYQSVRWDGSGVEEV